MRYGGGRRRPVIPLCTAIGGYPAPRQPPRWPLDGQPGIPFRPSLAKRLRRSGDEGCDYPFGMATVDNLERDSDDVRGRHNRSG
eukprot:1427380-Pyramimonas_sp.AAC.1